MNGKGIVYRFDIRDYWGYTLIDTSAPDFTLFYGGSDDDLAFAASKLDLNGKPIKYASLGWRGTFRPKRAGSRREASRKERFPELREPAAETILDLAPPPALGTITTHSNSTR